MPLNKVIIKNVERVLTKELHEVDLRNAVDFISNQLQDEDFIKEIDLYMSKLKDEQVNSINTFIIHYMLLGLGRNRTIEAMKDDEINRTDVDKVRIATGFNDSPIKKANEKRITDFKWDTKTRLKREKDFENVDWNKIKERYLQGDSPLHLGKEFGVSGYIISQRLKDEGLFEETRSTINKKRIAKDNYDKIDDSFIIQLMEENKMTAIDDLWIIAKERYPWLLRRQFHDKIKELGLKRTKAEISAIKSVKSKTMENTYYAIRINSIKAANKVFGSVDNMAKLYSNGEIGSYRKVADKINNESEMDFEISIRQVEKLITESKMYKRRRSSGQVQLAYFVRKNIDDNIIEEYYHKDTGKMIDIYIPKLNIGIEFNGEYWHSNKMTQSVYGTSDYEFHKERTDKFNEFGIRLVYVWEDDWNNNYVEVEKALINQEWDNPILNKFVGSSKRDFDERGVNN